MTDLHSGVADLACTDLLIGGSFTVGAGGSVVGVRHVHIAPGGRLLLDGGTLQLAQTWDNQGTVTTGGGQVIRAAGPNCPAVGPLGPIQPRTPTGQPSPVAVPATGPLGLGVLAVALAGLGMWQSRRRARAHEPTPLSR